MARKYIDFADVESRATIEQLAEMLNLDAKPSGRQLRCACPVHGGDDRTLAITPGVRSKRGSLGVFYCQKEQTGGDRIGLVAHVMEMGQQDAAFFIAEQFGAEPVDCKPDRAPVPDRDTVTVTVRKDRATVPESEKGRPEPAPSTKSFDPEAYAAKLVYTEQVAALGLSEEDAARLQIGFATTGMHRGRVVFPLRDAGGQILGFMGWDGEGLKFPKQLLPSKVIPIRKRA